MKMELVKIQLTLNIRPNHGKIKIHYVCSTYTYNPRPLTKLDFAFVIMKSFINSIKFKYSIEARCDDKLKPFLTV